MSFYFDNVITETYSFVPVISNASTSSLTIPALVPSTFFLVMSAKTPFLDQAKINSTS